MPARTAIGRFRDLCGWRFIRMFKQLTRMVFRNQFRQLGINSLYRADGSETIYSPTRILGYGMSEFEFHRHWPEHFEFIGPLTGAPVTCHAPPRFEEGKRHVLVSLGTHVEWAKRRAAELIQNVAPLVDCVFHFSLGKPNVNAPDSSAVAMPNEEYHSSAQQGNIHFYDFIPYTKYLDRYELAITHGGTGILYSCIQNGVPMLVWPQDFDHFDHAARIVHAGLGVRLQTNVRGLSAQINRLLLDNRFRENTAAFQQLALCYDAPQRFCDLVEATPLHQNN